MNLISQTKLAALAGVTKQRITAVLKAEPPLVTIVIDDRGKKKIDLDGHLTANYLKGRKPTEQKPQPEKKSKRGRPRDVQEQPVNPYEGAGDYQATGNPSGVGLPGANDVISGGGHGKTWYEIQLKKQQIEEKRIKNEQQRGNLIEKSTVELLFGRMYQIDVDQIKPLGVDLSPKIITITNELNKQKAKTILEALEITDKSVLKQVESVLNSGEKEMKTKIISVCEDISAGILANVQAEINNFLEVMETAAEGDQEK